MSQASLLIVDDDLTIRSTLQELFSKRYPCHAVASSEEALKSLSSVHYDVVLLDVSLPGMSGLELLARIRHEHPGTQVIIISGIDYEQHAGALFRTGAFDYLHKPFQLEDVVESVARAAARAMDTWRAE
jgi:DNA-binding NtrC family response regulator